MENIYLRFINKDPKINKEYKKCLYILKQQRYLFTIKNNIRKQKWISI